MNQNKTDENVKLKDKLYYARIIPRVGIYDVLELTVRNIRETYFSCVEKRDKHAYLFHYRDIGIIVFKNREDALNKVLRAEENKPKVSDEVYYEED